MHARERVPSGRTPDDRWPDDRNAACYWPYHKPLYDLGVDGWWPDQGDGLDGRRASRGIRMYWEGTQLWRPNERPFALHRNGAAGMQRYGAFLWSGDVQSRWETLKTHVPVAVNTGLSGIPFWGTDIGGFVPTAGLHRRAARALVPVRRVLSVVPRARPQLAPASCRGDGTAAMVVRRKPMRSRRRPKSCTTRRSSRSSGSTSSCAIG